MERVHVREELDAPIDRVWEAVRDFGDLRAWAPPQRPRLNRKRLAGS
jgi:uncharacterized protein YndB with AHSA1/START domain